MNADPDPDFKVTAEPDYSNLPERYRQPPDLAALIEVVDAEPAHGPLIGELTVRAYEPVHAGLYRSGDHLELADVAGRHATGVVLAALFNGFVIGAVTFIPAGSSSLHGIEGGRDASFDHLAVDPSSQRLGAGRALVQACIDRARAGGAARLLIRCPDSMPSARHLLRAVGFTQDDPSDHPRDSDAGPPFRLDL